MASQDPPPSNVPPSMGPGARPVQRGDSAGGPAAMAQIMKIRSKYSVTVESEVLQLGYELNGTSLMYRLPFESMPLRGFSRWLLYGGPKRARTTGSQVLDVIRKVEEVSHEPVTQREAEGITYHMAKASLYRLRGDFVACSLGGFIAYRNREKMKFPFMSPKPLERYNNFPTRHLPLVQGRYAQILWHITRANMWAGLFIVGLTPIFSSMGNFAAWSGIYLDERTQRVIQTFRPDKNSSDRAKADGGSQPAGIIQRQPRRQARSESQYSGSEQQDHYQTRETGAPYDYSATHQYEGEGEGLTDTGLVSDSSWRSQESAISGNSSYTKRSAPTQQTQPERQDRSFGSDPFFDDDASPKAGNWASISPTATSTPQTRSAWARIRSGNRPSNTQRSGPPGSESELQSESTEESSSKEWWGSRGTPEQSPGQTTEKLSQKEFDEMLERERRLSGSDEYSRGMRAVESGQDNATESGSGSSAWDRRRNQ
ncbi:hypothetical protein A1O3_05278 [Capronia epimyces CBS 606.96]|uniref:Uncharacterized protein n=1 Tax=Capronia epimyces CBS 606.96 TaxID=1182542 RepID=W9XWJ4_9EURO|nr:uncharacterized protein A1O3_05278 [Capronia epimyces CBS 606.96]EXJ84608.1 hypothetical protein A1O3_05278 [Capronia epimyces CBS 606.96]